MRSAVAVGPRSVCSAPKANVDCEALLISPPWRGLFPRRWRGKRGWFAEWGARLT